MSSSEVVTDLGHSIQTSNVYCIRSLLENHGLGVIIPLLEKFIREPPPCICMKVECVRIASTGVLFPSYAIHEEGYDEDDQEGLIFQDHVFKSRPEFRTTEQQYYGVFCVECSKYLTSPLTQFFGSSIVPMSDDSESDSLHGEFDYVGFYSA